METSSTPVTHSFKIGDIVALTSHPFTALSQDVLIGGDPLLISPLMVIVEIIGDSQNLYDENTGLLLQEKSHKTAQCKCIWYSSKSFQFEEAWLSTKLLKRIKEKNSNSVLKEKDNSDNYQNIQIGAKVTLSTAKMELKKLKSSYKSEAENERISINPLLSFVSPIMQIIGTAKNDLKEPSYDTKTGKKKREVSDLLIKCKWFNPSSEKMSEKLLPIDALTLIPDVDEEKLNDLQAFIKNKKHILIAYKGVQTILKPERIICVHGFYRLSGYDYIKNTLNTFPINKNLSLPIEGCQPYSIKHSNFKEENTDYVTQLEEVIINAIQNKNYLRIKYCDRHGNVTTRSVSNFKHSRTENGNYLEGMCMLRKAERQFHLDRIQFLEVLNVKFGTK